MPRAESAARNQIIIFQKKDDAKNEGSKKLSIVFLTQRGTKNTFSNNNNNNSTRT
jgi:hypothetical protein